ARSASPPPLVVERGGEANLFSGTIEPDHLAEAIAEGVPMRLREVVHLVFARINPPRGPRVQERLPEMSPGTFDQSDRRPLAPAEAIAELCDQFKSRGAATDHDDAVQRFLARDFHLCWSLRRRSCRRPTGIFDRKSGK